MTLHDAANELFDARDLCEGFADLNETLQAEAMLKQLSIKAGYYQILYSPIRNEAGKVWRNAPIADCMTECVRIAAEIREGWEAEDE